MKLPLKTRFGAFYRRSAPEKSVRSSPLGMHVDKLDYSSVVVSGSDHDAVAGEVAGEPDAIAGEPNDDFETNLADHQLSPTQAASPFAGPSTASNVTHFSYSSGSKPLPRYTIRRGIGMGGFGEVYFAVSDAGKEVALKRIQRNLEVELRGVSHCLNLKHPNLVSLHDICQASSADADAALANRDSNRSAIDPDQWWVVMEYIAGPNLRQVLDDSPEGLPGDEAMRWFTGMAAGIGHLHDAGLVHRDVKPGNVFDDQGVIKVGDYGLSKFISTSHRGGHTESVGTFHYMAPEIGRGQYGRQIDIYALGIVLHELLTGQVPFDGESCHEIIVKHLTAMPDLSMIDSPFRETIARCLEKDPLRRFATVGDMMQSLGSESSPSANFHSTRFHTAGPSFANATYASTAGSTDTQESPVHADLDPHASSDPSSPAMEKITTESITSEEPLARAVRSSLGELQSWWRTLDRSPGSKALLFTAGIVVLAINTHWLLPLLSLVGIVYVPYYVVRQMILHVRQQPSYAEAHRMAGTGIPGQTGSDGRGIPNRFIDKKQWRQHMRSGLRAKHSVHRVAELNTSWVAAVFTVAVLGVVAGIVGLRSGPITAITVAPYALIAVVVLFASVSLLGMGKLWEREDGEGLTRRLVLAGVGGGVGAVAYATGEFLMLPLNVATIRDVDVSTLPQTLYSSAGEPTVTAVMAHFALLLAALRWWKPIDPLRRKRLSLWSVAVAVVAEWGVHQLLPIPQPTGMMIAGGIAIVVQMSAPWIHPRTTVPSQPEPTGHPAGTNQTGMNLAAADRLHGANRNGASVGHASHPQNFQRGAV